MTHDEQERWIAEQLIKHCAKRGEVIFLARHLATLLRDAIAFADTTKVCDLCAIRYKNTRRTP